MNIIGPTVLIYLLIGMGVAVAFYVSASGRTPLQRGFGVATAVPFWPLYIPLLLTRGMESQAAQSLRTAPAPADEMTTAINQVDAELEAALGSLDGWAEDVLAREKDRIHELRSAWTAQSERIRDMDRLLALPEYQINGGGQAVAGAELSPAAAERLQRSQQVRRQNIERLRRVRQRAFEDLMGTLAWVRELVSMIHLAKFTGAPASRAEELVAQIAAAVEGLSELTWQDESPAGVGDST